MTSFAPSSAESLETRVPEKIAPRVPLALQPFALHDVRLLAGPFKHAQENNRRYLLFLEPDRFLHNFRVNAGLEPRALIYGGWEARGVAGQSLGHYLSALAQMWAATGDEYLKAKLDYAVSELAECQAQDAHGYIGAIPDGARIWDEIARGEVRASGFDLNGGWVPWYTQHKVFAGLRDAYLLGGNAQARQVLLKLADWAVYVTAQLSDEQWQVMLRSEHGGMNEVLADVYALTGETRYLDLARKFYHSIILEPLSQRRDTLDGQHANTQIPKVVGLARLYEMTGETPYRDTARFFWETVTDNRLYAIGGNSDREHFFPLHLTGEHLSPETAETCNTYNMLKLTEHLFCQEPQERYAAFAERALFNHILGSQDPDAHDQGGFNYMNPLEAGHFKVYSRPTDAFWCCVGTGLENHARYGESIYCHGQEALWVNLFIASEVQWRERGATLRQETRFPDAPQTAFTVSCEQPTQFTLKVRHPQWAKTLTALLNDEPLNLGSAPGSYASLSREWQDGDTLTLRFDIALSVEELRATPHQQALLYGPIVLAGDLGRSGMEGVDDYVADQNIYAHLPRPPIPLVIDEAGLLSRVERVGGDSLRFQLRAQDDATYQTVVVPLLPYSRAHHHRYAVYWSVYTPQGWHEHLQAHAAREQAARDLAARTLDTYRPHEQQSEVDHAMRGENTESGTANGAPYRDAQDGWFSFTMKVAPDAATDLIVRYWGCESGRDFDIVVDDHPLATQNLYFNRPWQFWDVTYPLPATLTEGRERVTIRFVAHPGSVAGGIYGARMVRRSVDAVAEWRHSLTGHAPSRD